MYKGNLGGDFEYPKAWFTLVSDSGKVTHMKNTTFTNVCHLSVNKM